MLVVDDSAVVRAMLSAELARTGDIEVVGTAPDPYAARARILTLAPDVITLDIEMPRMDGLTFLAKLMTHHPLPVVVVSSLTPEGSDTAFRALELGAVDVVPKPRNQRSIPDVAHRLADAIRAAAVARVGVRRVTPRPNAAIEPQPRLSLTDKLFAIGASTGGTHAIERLLAALPADAPGTILVQHMPDGFTAPFAKRLDASSPMTVREARDGDRLAPGLALVAPAGPAHATVVRSGALFVVRLREGPRQSHQRPSVDALFHSVAESVGPSAVGALLTGMGRDGADGLLAMRNAGARSVAESEESCVVYGMPRAAAELGAAEVMLPIDRVAPELMRFAR